MHRLVDDAADDVAKEHNDEVSGDCRRGAGRNPCAADIIDTTKERDNLDMILLQWLWRCLRVGGGSTDGLCS